MGHQGIARCIKETETVTEEQPGSLHRHYTIKTKANRGPSIATYPEIEHSRVQGQASLRQGHRRSIVKQQREAAQA